MINGTPYVFLGANTSDGFVNKFYNKYDNLYTYIIKGGPGCGKSSFMKAVAKRAEELNQPVIKAPCSSDPTSLDAVILPNQKIMIADGTSPHVLDPVYPGVKEEIINFGEFWNKEMLENSGEKIIELTDKNKALHKKASVCLNALGRVKRDNFGIYLSAVDIKKTAHFAAMIANRYLAKNGKRAKERVCFLSGETPNKTVFYQETINCLCEKKVIINDQMFAVSGIMMSIIRDIALANGYNILTAKNHLLPNEKIDHIIIPEANVAFCTEADSVKFNDTDRRTRTERFCNKEIIKKSANRIALNKKLEVAFLNQTHNLLASAKQVHDQLEEHYIKAMNYERLNEYTEKFINSVF